MKSLLKFDQDKAEKLMKFGQKSSPRGCQIIKNRALGGVLELFGDPLGAKVAQERQQELNKLKNIRFWGRPGSLKWTKNR